MRQDAEKRRRGKSWGAILSERTDASGPVPGPGKVVPVIFPPGRARLATSPSRTGSPIAVTTIGIVVVACCAARCGRSATMRSTRPTSSVARPGSRSIFPSPLGTQWRCSDPRYSQVQSAVLDGRRRGSSSSPEIKGAGYQVAYPCNFRRLCAPQRATPLARPRAYRETQRRLISYPGSWACIVMINPTMLEGVDCCHGLLSD